MTATLRVASLLTGSALALGLGNALGLVDLSVNQRARREAAAAARATPPPKVQPVAVPHKVEETPAVDPGSGEKRKLEDLFDALEREPAPASADRRKAFGRALIRSAEALDDGAAGRAIKRCVGQAELDRNGARRMAALQRCLKRFEDALAKPRAGDAIIRVKGAEP